MLYMIYNSELYIVVRMKIADKVAVVVGGARGIGKAYCEILLQKGANLCFGDILKKTGLETEEEFVSKYGKDRVVFRECNIVNVNNIEELFKAATEHFQHNIEICVNSAGVVNEFNWEKCLDVNLRGTIRFSEVALKYMGQDKGGKGGVLVLTSSLAGMEPSHWGPVYMASKHAIVGYMRCLAMPQQYTKHGVRVNCICPGTVDTELLNVVQRDDITAFPSDLKDYIQNNPMIQPPEVAEALVQVIENDSYNGASLTVTHDMGLKLFEYATIYPKK